MVVTRRKYVAKHVEKSEALAAILRQITNNMTAEDWDQVTDACRWEELTGQGDFDWAMRAIVRTDTNSVHLRHVAAMILVHSDQTITAISTVFGQIENEVVLATKYLLAVALWKRGNHDLEIQVVVKEGFSHPEAGDIVRLYYQPEPAAA